MDVPEAVNGIAQLPERVSAAACFGTPTTAGDRVAIPVAEVIYALGVGWGGGTSDERGHQEGSGGGAGGGARSRGVAVIEVAPGGVQVHPILDETSVTLAKFAFAAAAVTICATTLRALVRG